MCIPNHSQYCISLKRSQQQRVRAQLQKVNDSSDVKVQRDRQLMVRSSVVVYTVYTSSDSEITFAWRHNSYSRVVNSVRKKQPQLATFTLFPLSPVQEAGDNGTEKLLITPDHVSYTNYFMSIEISWCGVRLVKIAKPDKKQSVGKHIVSSQYDATITRCRVTAIDWGRLFWYRECKQVVGTSSWGSILRVSHLSHHTRTHHKCR